MGEIVKNVAFVGYYVAGLLLLANTAIWVFAQLIHNDDRKHKAAIRMLVCGIVIAVFVVLYVFSSIYFGAY